MNRLECLGKSSTNLQKQVSCQETECSRYPSGDTLNENDNATKMHVEKTPSEEQVQQTAELVDKLKITDLKRARSTASAQTEMQHVSPEVNPHPSQEEEEDIKTPVELKIKFLKAVRGGDFELACKLCQIILTYEPENPEASEFLPLIKKKLQEAQSSEEEDDDDDEEDDEDSDDNE